MMDDPFLFHQWPVNPFNDLSSSSGSCAFFEPYSQQQHVLLDFKGPAQSESNRPLKQLKPNSFNSCKNENQSNCFHLLDLSSTNPVGIFKAEREVNIWSPSESNLISQNQPKMKSSQIKFDTYHGTEKTSTSTKITQSKDHILAERRRREKFNQKFIALSLLVPGLKKTDKASVLGDAIEYIKKLQKKIKILEEQNKKKTMGSVVFVKKFKLLSDGQDSSSDESIGPITTEKVLPQIEARFCNKNVLIHVHCEKIKGVMEKIVTQIEKLHLLVVNSSVVSFGDSALDITVIVQKDEEFGSNMDEVVKKLCGAFKILI